MRASEVLRGAVPLWDRAEVLPGGRVGGLRRAMHVRQAVVFQEHWQRLYVEGALREPFEQDSHSVLDVLCFALRFERDRRKCKRRRLAGDMVLRLRDSFLQWLGPSLDTYFSTVYRLHHDIHKPAPSLALKPQPQLGDKNYVKVHPEVIWDLMEEAQSSSASVAQVLRIRRRDSHAGSCVTAGLSWVGKRMCMYASRRNMCFGPGVHHINVIADPATHSKKEVMVSVLWSWEEQVAGHGDPQWISATKTILPCDQEPCSSKHHRRAVNKFSSRARCVIVSAMSPLTKWWAMT
jgi:hypothetical protein